MLAWMTLFDLLRQFLADVIADFWMQTRHSVSWRNVVVWLRPVLALAVGRGSESEPAPSDVELRQRVLGIWEDEYQGHRTMTVRRDGTATMVVVLHGWKAKVYAAC